MSSVLSSQGIVLATAMAVSGTVIFFTFGFKKFPPTSQFSSERVLKPCLSSDGKKNRDKKKQKRVHFAEDVMDPRGDGEEFRKQHCSSSMFKKNDSAKNRGMPANRIALYSGILRDRRVNRLAYSC